MPEEIKKDEEVIEEEEKEVEEKEDDKSGEDEEEEKEVEKDEEESDEVDLEKLRPEKLPDKKDDEEGDDIDEDDDARISKVVFREVAKVTELNSFIRKNPEFAKYESVMIEYKNHPHYKNVPIESIAAIVSSKDAQKIGAKKEREIAKIVKETKSPGNTVRKLEDGGTDWSKVSNDEFETKRSEVLGQNN